MVWIFKHYVQYNEKQLFSLIYFGFVTKVRNQLIFRAKKKKKTDSEMERKKFANVG